MRRIVPALAMSLALSALPVSAQTVDTKDARKMLFGTSWTVELGEASFLDKSMQKVIEAQLRGTPGTGYYGAIAVSPGEPTSSNLMSTMANFHSPETAQQAALDNCNSRRTIGNPCIVIATIMPKRYKAQPLTLSAQATEAFNKEYRKLDAPKAMAISPSTGVFGIDRGDGGRAISKCNAAAQAKGAADCVIVVADQ